VIEGDAWFEGFDARRVDVGEASIFLRAGGNPDRPALVLLHGFPQSHVMWHRVARQLVDEFWIVMPDLRGYGDSSSPPGEADHSNYSKRSMANDVVAVMDDLGRDRFFVCGHDRGGRVAHRLSLDHGDRVERLCVVDIAPTLDMYDRADMAFARAYYHWFFLIQRSPLPERMIAADAQWYLSTLLGGWGSNGLAHIEPSALAEYRRCFTPDTIHAMCEDYRASAGIDLDHDRESRQRGDKLGCPVHVLWGTRGVIERFYDPLALWQQQSVLPVTGSAMQGGHFLPEELPEQTAAELRRFFGAGS
jgi:haloacetate dehalogenase